MVTQHMQTELLLDSGINEMLRVSPGQHLTHIQILDGSPNHVTVEVQRDASYTHIVITDTPTTSTVAVALTEPRASASLYGLVMLSDTSTHVRTSVTHRTDDGRSNQEYRHIVGAQSTLVVEAELEVRSGAKGNDSSQYCRNLILTDNCDINIRPHLRIANDNVSCRHGIANGTVNEKALHYLTSRGIPQPIATSMLVHAFAQEIIRLLPTKELQHQALLKLATVL